MTATQGGAETYSVVRELRDWLSSRSGIGALIALAAGVVYTIWLSASGGAELHAFVFNLWSISFDVLAGLSVIPLLRHQALDERTRRAWRMCMAAFFVMALGDITWFIYDSVLGGNDVTNLAALPYAAYFPVFIAGMLRFTGATQSRGDRYKLVLDVSLVLVAGGVILWYFLLSPHARPQTGATRVDTLLAFGNPLGDFVIVFVTAVVLLMRPPMISRAAVYMLALASVARMFSTLAFGYAAAQIGTYQTGGWTDMGWALCPLLWFWAAQYQRWRADRGVEHIVETRNLGPDTSVLPYLAIVAGYGLLVLVARPYWSQPIGVVIGAALVLTVIVTVRQWLGVRENARLVDDRIRRDARFRSLVQHSSDVITVIDDANIIRFMSPAVERVLGWTPDDGLGKSLLDIVHRDDIPAINALLDRIRPELGASASDVWRCRNRAGEWRYIETVATSLIHDPTVCGIVLNTRDVSERVMLQQELTHQAYHDPLTHLANRAWFHAQVERAVTRAKDCPEHVAVFFLDLDNFKNINDSLGHGEGDRVLQLVAERLLNATRGSDTVARLGGDEFAVLVERITSIEGLTTIADRITHAMRLPFRLDNGEVFSGASIGITRGGVGEGVDDLLRNADVAMYVSKREGKGAYTLFEPRMHEAARARLGLETDLRIAVEQNQFHLVFQPIVSMANHRPVGVEALLRWDHPTRGVLAPDHFIGMVEESGLILPLGRWVLNEACQQGARWRSMLSPQTPFMVAVNVSRRQLQHARFIEDVAIALREHGFPASSLLLEITESVIMHDIDAMAHRLRVLKSLGIRIAIDDFGTGYSSLGALRQFPIDVLKIDKSFIDDTASSDSNGTALARTIVALGQTLSLQTVAEGVEQEAQADVLRAMGCDVAQGFHFSRPVQPSAIDALLRGESDHTTPESNPPSPSTWRRPAA